MILITLLLILLVLVNGSPTSTAAAVADREKVSSVLYLANHAQAELTVTAACGAAYTSAAPGETAFLDCVDPSAAIIGVAWEGQALLDATDENNFLVHTTCPDGFRTLQGAVEIVEGLRPQRRDYFVHLWTIGECAR